MCSNDTFIDGTIFWEEQCHRCSSWCNMYCNHDIVIYIANLISSSENLKLSLTQANSWSSLLLIAFPGANNIKYLMLWKVLIPTILPIIQVHLSFQALVPSASENAPPWVFVRDNREGPLNNCQFYDQNLLFFHWQQQVTRRMKIPMSDFFFVF